MASVSITELKAHLAEYLRRVQEGERFHVTVRGKEVADIVPADPVRAALWRMVEAGEAEWSGEDMVAPGRPAHQHRAPALRHRARGPRTVLGRPGPAE